MKKLLLAVPIILTMSCQTRLVSVKLSGIESQARAAIHQYYPEYRNADLIIESVSYTSHISLLLPENARKLEPTVS